MRNNNYIFIILIALLYSCSPYKFKFIPTTDKSASKISTSYKYLKEDELFLCFTKEYNRTKISVLENDSKIFDSLITTDSRNIAKALKVNKNSTVAVHFEGIEKPLQITNEQMRQYKFIYVEKAKNRVVVEFNNGTKTLKGKSNYIPTVKDSMQN